MNGEGVNRFGLLHHTYIYIYIKVEAQQNIILDSNCMPGIFLIGI